MTPSQKIHLAAGLIERSGPLHPFLPDAQRKALIAALSGEEGEYFADKLHELAQQIESMPQTYEQDGKGDQAVAHLHYFRGGADFWITEKDMEGGVTQAFGLACTTGDLNDAEMGYISITEITEAGVELDLYWTPKTLAEVKRGTARAADATPDDESPSP